MPDKAVFLDRDGTIIEDVGYLNNPADIKFIPGSLEAIKLLNKAGYKIIIVTNQAGIARGLIREDMLQTIDKTIQRLILNNGAYIEGIYYCPFHAEHGIYPYKQDSQLRKPNPGMLLKAAKDHNIDLAHSWMIGDKDGDIGAGKNAGTKTAFVKTGLHTVDRLANKPDIIAEDLMAAVKTILGE
ncbi:MAG: HAD family hydrolase [bacterium]